MNRLLRIGDLVMIGCLASGATACKQDDVSKESDRAAERVNDVSSELRKETGEAIDDVVEVAAQVEPAMADFELKRAARVDTLRAVHSVSVAQPLMINGLAKTVTHSQSEEARLVERLSVLEVRIEETGQLIQQLEHVEAPDWEARNEAIGQAMSRLESARESAWETLDTIAKANGRTSMK